MCSNNQDNQKDMVTTEEQSEAAVAAIRSHWTELISQGQVLEFRANQTIFYQDHMPTGVFILHKGQVGLGPDHIRAKLHTVSADSQPILGLDFLMSGSVYGYSAKALSDTVLCFISKNQIFNCIYD